MPKAPTTRTRTRVVTSCTECHRRKQKCDREQPCNFCVRRGIPGSCSYNHRERAGPYSTSSDVGGSINVHNSSIVSSPSTHSREYADAIGYAANRSDDEDNINATSAAAGLSLPSPPTPHRLQRYAHHSLHGGTQLSFSQKFRLMLSELPSHTVLAYLVAVFFAEVNAAAQVLERYYFDKTLVEWLTVTATRPNDALEQLSRHVAYFPALLFQVLAMGVHFLPKHDDVMTPLPAELQDTDTRKALAQRYSSLGEELMTLLGRQNSTICGVEHDILRVYWLKTTGRGTAAWHVLGTGIRQAQDQCLHLRRRPRSDHGPFTNTELWFEEYRCRLWATLFIWDSHMGLTLNRPRAINLSDCTIERPLDCDFPADPTIALYPQPNQTCHTGPPSLVAVKLFSYDLGIIIHQVFTSGAHQTREFFDDLISREDEINHLLQHLHPTLRPDEPDTSLDHINPRIRLQRLYISLVAHSVILSLYRSRSLHGAKCAKRSIESALAVLEAQELILGATDRECASSSSGSCAFYYSMSCYTMDASIFLSHALSSGLLQEQHLWLLPSELDFRARQAVHRSIEALKTLRERSPLADCGVRILSAAVRSGLTRELGAGGTSRPDYGLSVTAPEDTPLHPAAPMALVPQQSQDPLHYASPPTSTMTITLGNRLPQDIFEEFLLDDGLPEIFSVNFLTDPSAIASGDFVYD